MDDLIRREDVLRIIKAGWSNHCSCKDMCDEIKELPTAYDVDKVCEKLNEMSYVEERNPMAPFGDIDTKVVTLSTAKLIVKAGGVNES